MNWLEVGPLRWVIIYDLLVFALFVVEYATLANWRVSPIGRHLMWFGVVITALVAISLMQNLYGPAPIWAWLAGFAALGAVGTHRVWLLVKLQRRERYRQAGEDEDAE